MLYTIGLSFSAELLVKGLYENTLGRVSEWIGGWDSADDRYATKVQQRYGAFMHETPWYEFPFGEGARKPVGHERAKASCSPLGTPLRAQRRIWGEGRLCEADRLRRRERASAATSGHCGSWREPRRRPFERSIRASSRSARTAAGTARRGAALRAVHRAADASFAHATSKLVEISGNDDIFVTALVPAKAQPLPGAKQLMVMPLADRPGWQRVGLSTKVPALLPLMRSIRKSGGQVEHVYDY